MYIHGIIWCKYMGSSLDTLPVHEYICTFCVQVLGCVGGGEGGGGVGVVIARVIYTGR